MCFTMDRLTADRDRVAYARVLVEVDTSKPVKEHVKIGLPNGICLNQMVKYETVPKFCAKCKRIGHLLTDCKVTQQSQGATRRTRDMSRTRQGSRSRGASQIPQPRKDGNPGTSGAKGTEAYAGIANKNSSFAHQEGECSVFANQDMSMLRIQENRERPPLPRPAAVIPANVVDNSQEGDKGEVVRSETVDDCNKTDDAPAVVAVSADNVATEQPESSEVSDKVDDESSKEHKGKQIADPTRPSRGRNKRSTRGRGGCSPQNQNQSGSGRGRGGHR